MNRLQKTISDISGYNYLEERGAADDGYYGCKTKLEKKEYINLVNEGVDFTDVELDLAYKFLEGRDASGERFKNQNDMFYAFDYLADKD